MAEGSILERLMLIYVQSKITKVSYYSWKVRSSNYIYVDNCTIAGNFKITPNAFSAYLGQLSKRNFQTQKFCFPNHFLVLLPNHVTELENQIQIFYECKNIIKKNLFSRFPSIYATLCHENPKIKAFIS